MTTISQLIQRLIQEGVAQNNWTISQLTSKQNAVFLISSQLNEYGITSVAPKTMGGSMSLVVELPERNQVLRIVDSKKERSPAGHPLMLQPDHDLGEIDGFRVQIFPKVKLLSQAIEDGSISKKEALKKIIGLVDAFLAREELFWDVRVPNICVTAENELKLLDPGSVCPISERYDGLIGNDTHTNDDKFKKNIAYLCEELGEWTPAVNRQQIKQEAKLTSKSAGL